jgi:hypothetical protein
MIQRFENCGDGNQWPGKYFEGFITTNIVFEKALNNVLK